MQETESSEAQARSRNALVVLVGGAVLVLWAWGSWVYRSWTPQDAGGEFARPGLDSIAESEPLSPWPFVVPFLCLAGVVVIVAIVSRKKPKPDAPEV